MAAPDLIQGVIAALKDNIGLDYSYFEGDPIQIPNAYLPAICVLKDSGGTDWGPTGFDQVTDTLTIKVLLNKLNDMGASPDTDLAERRLRRIIEGRDDTTGNYLPESVLGVLRTKITLPTDGTFNTFDQAPVQTNYGVVPRPDDVLTAEGHVSITYTYLVQVPTRA